MDSFSHPGLLHLQALYIDHTDTHARHGAHVRVAHHPWLGLPVAPFVLERADVDRDSINRLFFRQEALFTDQTGAVRTPPFAMLPGDEITAHIPTGAGELAIWAEVQLDPLGNMPVTSSAFIRSVGAPDTLLGRRDAMPVAFAGTGIVRIVLRGHAAIAGIRWLNANDQQKLKYQVVDVLNLPHPGGRRYAYLSDWEVLCQQRRDAQSPIRRHLHDTDRAPPRAAAPGFSPSEEKARVAAFWAELAMPLDELVKALAPPLQQVIRREMKRADGSNVSLDGSGELVIRSLGLFLQAQADPGMASYCGYKSLDTTFNGKENHRLSLYRLTSFHQDPDDRLLKDALTRGDVFASLAVAARTASGPIKTSQVAELWGNLAGSFLSRRSISAQFDLEGRNCLVLTAHAVADHHAPQRVPDGPVLDTPIHKHWLPGQDIKHPLRVTETGVRGLMSGAAMAGTRRQPPGSSRWFAQNSALETTDGTWRALILPNLPVAAGMPSAVTPAGVPEAFLSDPATGPEAFEMHVAQMDRFGRWSEWASANAAAGPRPRPPRPVVRGSYRQPAVSSGSHQGRINVAIPLPPEDSLAPGAFALTHAVLTVQVEGVAWGAPITLPVSSVVSLYPGPDPVPAGQEQYGLTATFDGPVLPLMATRYLELTAVWHDSAGQTSVPSELLRLRMTDPYPPAQTPVPETLLYAARPDATGRAWVERRWVRGGSGVSHAVYYTDENRLREHLRGLQTAASTALLNTLQAEPNPATRAGLLRDHQGLFPAHLFERLKNVVEDVDATHLGFRHSLSGSLRVLSGYKVVAEALDTAARPALETVDTVFYGVPNSDPPAQPVITARLVAAQEGEPELVVELTVQVRAGTTRAASAQIRRTRSGVADALANPIVGTAPFGAPDPVTGLQTAIFRDIGRALMAPVARLAPFTTYAWLAQAQGEPEPGSVSTIDGPVPGLWSKPSSPVTLSVVPAGAPSAPLLMARRGAVQLGGVSGLELDFSHANNLVPTALGPWTIAVDRQLPGSTMERIAETAATAGTTFTVHAAPGDPAFVVPEGTLLRVRLIDPLGRESPVTDHRI